MTWENGDLGPGDSLTLLLQLVFINVSKYFKNKTPNEHEITDQGARHLKEFFDIERIRSYIKTFYDPELIVKLTEAYYSRWKT
jgi:hypothetical protein